MPCACVWSGVARNVVLCLFDVSDVFGKYGLTGYWISFFCDVIFCALFVSCFFLFCASARLGIFPVQSKFPLQKCPRHRRYDPTVKFYGVCQRGFYFLPCLVKRMSGGAATRLSSSMVVIPESTFSKPSSNIVCIPSFLACMLRSVLEACLMMRSSIAGVIASNS